MKDKYNYLLKLRNATKVAHNQVEKLTEGNDLIKNPSKDKYIYFLITHYLFREEIFHHIISAEKTEGFKIGCLEREKATMEAIIKDLNILGVETQKPQKKLESQSALFSLGMYYVMKGASMGNNLIFNELKNNLDFLSWNATNFLETSQQDFLNSWKSFRKELLIQLHNNYDEIEKGSLKGFQLYGQLYSQSKEIMKFV
ncbi:biliverdin-producing heme oxygenase [Aquimarina algicola]|uniref:Biliverdin-producing heme oxygenase n=1 Tax=Aquimarina algicola TaxID=2589995 RepID=A0A504J101_9FLAO|nr:biliverdin-producing heme oxygenase [Aquimarina algicola]TPN84507.1 biliverdin-producing heme oxygenase [Aquimarina algicola]